MVKEFIQHLAVPSDMADEAARLLNSDTARTDLQAKFGGILADLHVEGASRRAAETLLQHASD